MTAVLAGDEVGDAGAQGMGGEAGIVAVAHAGGEQRAQPERAARGVDAGAGDNAADRAFMQVEGAGHLGHGEGQEAGGTMVERLGLMPEDFASDAEEGGIAGLDQAEQGAGGALTLTATGADVDAGKRGAVEREGPAFGTLARDQVGFADGGGEAVELRAGLWVEAAQAADGEGDVRLGQADLLGEAGQVGAGDEVEVFDQGEEDGVDRILGLCLKSQAFGEVAGEEAGGIDPLQALQDGADLREGGGCLGCDGFQRGAEPAGGFQRLGQGEGDAGIDRGEGFAGDPVGHMGDQAGRCRFEAVGDRIGAAEEDIPAREPVAGGRGREQEGGVFGGLFFQKARQAFGIGLEEADGGMERRREVEALGCLDLDPWARGHGDI